MCAQVWRYRSGLGRWVPAAKLGPQERVTCVHWACTMGRSVELVAVGASSHVTVFSLQGAADAPQVRPMTARPEGQPWQVPLAWSTALRSSAVPVRESERVKPKRMVLLFTRSCFVAHCLIHARQLVKQVAALPGVLCEAPIT